MKINSLLAGVALMATSYTVCAQDNTVTVQTKKIGADIQPTMYGVFFEDINFGADGGLYAELVKNRSFEFAPDHYMGWKMFGNVTLQNDGPFDKNPHYVRLGYAGHGDMWTGIQNEGFFGIGKSMKDAELVCDCSDIDDVIVFTKDGRYVITKVSDKAFFEKGIYYIGVFKRNDDRTIYNVLYRDGKNGAIMMKRCAIKGITRDKEYDITKGTAKSEILYMSVNPNGEAEVLKVYFKPRPRLKKVIVDLDFSTLAIKGRQSQGNLFSRYGIHKIVLKERGTSTLGGQDIWFDEDVRRLNADGRGKLLGEFKGDDRLIVWTSKNQYYITGYDLMQHFPDDTVLVARYESDRVYSLCYYDRGQKYYYMKRFTAEMSDKIQDFLDADADFICVTDRAGAKLEITYKGAHASRPADVIDVDEFVGVKSHRAKGKRLTTYDVDRLRMIESELPPEPEPSEDESLDDGQLTDASADAAQRAAAEGKASGKSALKEPLGAKPAPGKAPAGQPSAGTIVGGVEFEVERPKGDAGEMIDPEQLNLF